MSPILKTDAELVEMAERIWTTTELELPESLVQSNRERWIAAVKYVGLKWLALPVVVKLEVTQ